VNCATPIHFLACVFSFSVCAANASSTRTLDEAESPPSAPVDLERAKLVLTREIEQTIRDTGIPSISIALLHGDRVVWADAFGDSNVKLKVPATSSTIYGTGSCLKPVTAMAVMQLVDDGSIGLDDPVNKYLGEDAVDDLSAKGKPVTVRHLLSHYSGLTVIFEALPLWNGRRPRSLRQLAAELKAEQESALSRPG